MVILALLTLILVRVDIKPLLVLLRKYKPEQHLKNVLAEQLPALATHAELRLALNKAKKIVTALVSPLQNVVAVVQAVKNVLTVLVLMINIIFL